jgi:dsDNA-specific endonuclease/ATPase MutS2
MSQVERISPNGVLATIEAGTPSPLPPGQTADALETIEFAQVLELVAAHAAGPLGAERVRSRWPSDELDWIRNELARAAEVAMLFCQGDGLLAEPVPDVSRALSRLRIEGSVLEGVELAAIHRVLQAARQVRADLLRVAEAAPRAAELACPPPDKAIERRLELSVDQDGALLDTASPRLASVRREIGVAVAWTGAGSCADRCIGHRTRWTLRYSGATRLPQPSGGNHPR